MQPYEIIAEDWKKAVENMKLFDETENKYYELVARLLQNGKSFNKKELYRLIGKQAIW